MLLPRQHGFEGAIMERTMKRIFLTLVITWSLVGAPIPAVAQSSEFMAAHNSYKTLNQHGRYSEAEPFARKALELGEAEFGTDHTIYADLLINLATLYKSQVRYEEAEPLYKRDPLAIASTNKSNSY